MGPIDRTLAVAAQYEIYLGQFVPAHVQVDKADRCAAIRTLVCRDEFRNYICSDISRRIRLESFHPVIIATWRIEQRLHGALFDECRQFSSDNSCLVEV